jgi:hypothetical protein
MIQADATIVNSGRGAALWFTVALIEHRRVPAMASVERRDVLPTDQRRFA